MLLNPLSSPRRLVLLGICIFVIAIVLYQSTSESGIYLPKTTKITADSGSAAKEWHYNNVGQEPRPDTERPAAVLTPPHDPFSDLEDDVVAPPPKVADSPHTPSPNTQHQPPVVPDSAVYPPPDKVPEHPQPEVEQHEDEPTQSTPQPGQWSEHDMQQLLKQWTPPNIANHWPPYDWYYEKDYDPNRWEGFEWNNDFYIQNGVKRLQEKGIQPIRYAPYPDYHSPQWKAEWRGDFNYCMGPRGKLLNESDEDILKAYSTVPEGFPAPVVGDAEFVGIDIKHCLDRELRFGPYTSVQAGHHTTDTRWIDWDNVAWGDLQNRCLQSNAERFAPDQRQPSRLEMDTNPQPAGATPPSSATTAPSYRPRTALLIRSWEGYEYTENDLEAIRSLISELNLQSGAEYHVFLFINIKKAKPTFYQDQQEYDQLVQDNAPKEFQGITILWSEAPLAKWYPKVGDYQVYWQQFMSLQWFSKTHPEFDYVWNWEVDARYTGNHYHFLEAVANYSRRAPRKYMWERNSRFYIPEAHGSFLNWLEDTHVAVENATKEGTLEPVWGSRPYNGSIQKPIGPIPPGPMSDDNFEWGVGEEADLITLQPIWDPARTEWTMKDKIWNFISGVKPGFSENNKIASDFTHPDFAKIPRRAYINTLSRFSKQLLHAMHVENAAGRAMQAEMWPATVALHYGLKAVHAPHPIWADRKWPAWYMDAIFNARGNDTAAWNAREDTAYNHDREHNFGGWSWFYQTDFPRVLYRRWLGWETSVGEEKQFPNNALRVLGGKDYEESSRKIDFAGRMPDGSQAAPAGGSSFGGREIFVGGHGAMCLPPMLLHPVKNVKEDQED